MTPEEIEQHNEKLRAEHDSVLGPIDPEIARPEPATVDPIEIDKILNPDVEAAAAQSLKDAHDKLFGKIGSQQPPPPIAAAGPVASSADVTGNNPLGSGTRGEATTDSANLGDDPRKWKRETAKALDLSDASRVGEYSQEPDGPDAMGGVLDASSRYMSNMTNILRTMQALITEHAIQIDELQSRFNRLR